MCAVADRTTISPSAVARGRLQVPGDKSISHRYALIAALADGRSTISNFSPGADCASTLACLRALGIGVRADADKIVIDGRGLHGFTAPRSALDAGNSGTTIRLLAGIIAGQSFTAVITGDESLRRRPMRRVIEPLAQMGAGIESDDGRAPLVIRGAQLRAVSHRPAVPSAQVKSCVLLAGLLAEGETELLEPIRTRDHTERAFETFNVRSVREGTAVRVAGGQTPSPRDVAVPGDVSSAAFWCVLAAGTPGGCVEIVDVGLNPTRTHYLDVLRRAGAEIDIHSDNAPGEPRGTISVRGGTPQSFTIGAGEVPLTIDEIPALAALAAMMPPGHSMAVRGAGELRVKESDRITALVEGFRMLGARTEEFADGFALEARPLRGGTVDAAGDHRLAMAFAIAATRATAPVTITGASSVAVSYPGFFETLANLTRGASGAEWAPGPAINER